MLGGRAAPITALYKSHPEFHDLDNRRAGKRGRKIARNPKDISRPGNDSASGSCICSCTNSSWPIPWLDYALECPIGTVTIKLYYLDSAAPRPPQKAPTKIEK